jgi:hypothetical protein
MNNLDINKPDVTLLESWQRHVLECKSCGMAAKPDDMCQMGKNFWRLPGSASFPVEIVQPVLPPVAAAAQPSQVFAPSASAPQPIYAHNQPQYQPAAYIETQVAPLMPPPPQNPARADIERIASHVSERVAARTSTGASVLVPMEKQSRAVSFSTAPGVILHMPERDIEVYSFIKNMIIRYAILTEKLGTYLMAREEGKRFAREQGITLNDRETALVVRRVADARGVDGVTSEDLYLEFSEVTTQTIRLGDGMSRFMNVDTETRAIMKEVRQLYVDMQGEVERSSAGQLSLDEQSHRIVRQMRMLAVSLQGELDRRLGT